MSAPDDGQAAMQDALDRFGQAGERGADAAGRLRELVIAAQAAATGSAALADITEALTATMIKGRE